MWEGNNIFFFVPITTFYQTQQYTSVSVVSKRICCRSNESKCSCFSKGLQQQLSANEAKAHFCGGGEIKNFLYPTPTTGQLLLFAFSYSSPLPHCSLRRTKSRKNKILNILLFSSHALGASGDSHQQTRNDRARAARCFSVDGESWNPAFHCILSSHPHFQSGPKSSRFSSNNSHVSSLELF